MTKDILLYFALLLWLVVSFVAQPSHFKAWLNIFRIRLNMNMLESGMISACSPVNQPKKARTYSAFGPCTSENGQF